MSKEKREGYIPPEERNTILLLADDLRLPSGVGTMSREFVMGTCHRFNWVQLGAAVKHPEVGKAIDASELLKTQTGVDDADLKIYPYNGYGDASIMRYLLMRHMPNAILHFTDPRYWAWLYNMESEIRENIPIIYYHVWDSLPFPRYNRDFYRSCDGIMSISRQTHNIVRNVLGEENVELIDMENG